MKKLYFLILGFILISLDIPIEKSRSDTQKEVQLKIDQSVEEIKDNTLQLLYDQTKMDQIASSYFDNGWIDFKYELKINPENIFEIYKSNFGLGKNDKMKLEQVTKDTLGYTHYTFQQYFNDLKVLGMRYTIHSKDEIAISANGKIAHNLLLNVKPTINKEEAIANTLKYKEDISLSACLIEDSDFDNGINELLIVRKPDAKSFLNSDFRLAYKMIAFDTLQKTKYKVYYDIDNNNVLNIEPLARNSSPTYLGTCKTHYNGMQSVYTFYHNANWPCPDFYHLGYLTNHEYRIEDGTSCGTQLCPRPCFDDADNYWDYDSEKDETTSFWAVQKARTYFANTFGLYGIDGNYHDIHIRARYYYGYPNSEFYPEPAGDNYWYYYLRFGQSVSGQCNPMMSLDIVGHEYTHGVIFSNWGDGLQYSGETGAIEEGICDVFGSMVQSYVEGYNQYNLVDLYTTGEDALLVNNLKRSLMNPNSMGEHSTDMYCNLAIGTPDTYLGTNWETRTCSGLIVHTNSTVMSHWFYLLSEGGTGYNDFNYYYQVNGIGRSNAAAIVYRMIKEKYFSNYANYSDARNGTMKAAADLFGLCSNEFNQVKNAWAAVGVSSEYVGLDGVKITPNVSMVCSQTTFGLNCMPCSGSVTVTWYKSSNLSFVGSNVGNSVTVSPLSSGSGYVYAVLTTSCGNYTVPNEYFWVGTPQLSYINGPTYGYTGSQYHYQAYPSYNSESGATYTWTLSPLNGNYIYSYLDYADIAFYNPYMNYILSVSANNTCGTSYSSPIYINIEGYGYYSLSPNPATNQVTITVDNKLIETTDITEVENTIYTVRIFNMYGVLQSTTTHSGSSFTIPISGLKDGNYIVQIYNGKETESLQLIVKK